MLEILLLGGFAWVGGAALRRRLLPRLEGAPVGLATAVLALALLIWPAELLGSLSALDPVPYLLLVAAIGLVLWRLVPRPEREEARAHHPRQVRVRTTSLPTLIALLVALVAVIHFAAGVKTRLSTGMTGFDSTWYHGPFATGFFQSGNTWDLHFIAPQFLAWFYPANGEILHTVGMLAFGRDVLSPLLNFGWFLGCLLAAWCIGRPYGKEPWSLALGAIALSVPALADQAGEARNDIVGIFFLLAAVALALNFWAGERAQGGEGLGKEDGAASVGPYLVVGLGAGLAAGTKLNFLLPAAVLVVGLALIAPSRERLRALVALSLAALAGGGYWYLRNLVHAGNPLPWIHHLGPIELPAPQQAIGGREAHSVLGYLGDGAVWSEWFLPGLHHALWLLWPLPVAAAFTGLLLAMATPVRRGDGNTPTWREIASSAGVLAVAGAVGLASAAAWLVAPTSASGPEGMPHGFESGLRYFAPALVLGLALLPTVSSRALGRVFPSFASHSRANEWGIRRGWAFASALAALLLAVAIGYPVQRHYLENRYADPTFAAPGLNAAFAWARELSDARIATTSTRQYPLFGTDLSNHVTYIGEERSHGGFAAPTTCRRWRHLLNEGNYDYAVATRDRIEPAKPSYPPSARWTEGPSADVVLRIPPTVVFRLSGPLTPSACPRGEARAGGRVAGVPHSAGRGQRARAYGGGPP